MRTDKLFRTKLRIPKLRKSAIKFRIGGDMEDICGEEISKNKVEFD
jgi:hypothetical protein